MLRKNESPLTQEEKDLIECHLNLIYRVAHKAKPRDRYEFDEWVQEGVLASIVAIRTYDPKKSRLCSWIGLYAQSGIRNFRHSDNIMRIPRVVTEKNKSKEYNARFPMSLDDLLIDENSDKGTLVDHRECKESDEHLEIAISRLCSRDRELVDLYFMKGCLLREIANLRGCSVQAVQKLLAKILLRLRREYCKLEGVAS